MFMKKTYIECLRIIAIILVIYNHTRELGFTLYQYTSDACSYYLSVFMIPVCKTAVPIFLMISGATLLGKKKIIGNCFPEESPDMWGLFYFGELCSTFVMFGQERRGCLSGTGGTTFIAARNWRHIGIYICIWDFCFCFHCCGKQFPG